MQLFLSAGEPSGDLHGANLARVLHERAPELSIVGFGGDKMAGAGVKLLYPLTNLAVMWVGRVLVNLPTFFKIVRRAEVYLRSKRPAALVVIDYPGFHWALIKRAHRVGVPVFYFVPPQLWAWAGWRVSKMNRWADTVLTALPFEETWYRQRGVRTHYVGHPYFDELAEQQIDLAFVAARRAEGVPIVALLPGSRNQEVTANFPLMLAAAARIREAVPGTLFLIAGYNERLAKTIRQHLAGSGITAELYVGRTPEVIEAADACIAVSGSVGFELMYRLKPTVVVYKISDFARFVSKQFIVCKYISLVNLVADEEVYPEFLTTKDSSPEIAAHIVGWLTKPESRERLVERLHALRTTVAVPGACERAADFILGRISASQIGTSSQLVGSQAG
ncbi:lipid-A-disaccharide synthase [Fimbriiglobus ruber]|uniref:Lipid-A-disaccharide synthase n=1 Tax=Fimbriiglobus ruber TaxID=1908690 RepID=A0A225DQV7_9BACT|nr:lipid-A-disaccharide synthase [Fimbriiglobus ruber]OWK43860.1 Lipid-A-disaccharide synthase [Fimbriiglobus ruber]